MAPSLPRSPRPRARAATRAVAGLVAVLALGAGLPATALAGPDPVNQPLKDGCQRNPGGLLSYTSPEWVFVGGDEKGAVRSIAGKATLNHTADEDLPESHFSYDLDSDVVPDPAYTGLLAGTPQLKNGNWADDADRGKLHVEWESGAVPAFVWPTEGDRVKYWGRWVWDCGHWGQGIQIEEDNPQGDVIGTGDYFLPGQVPLVDKTPEGLRGEQTELHPLEAMVVSRRASWQSPTGEHETDVFMSDEGTHALAESRCAHDNRPPTPAAVYGPDFSACVNSGTRERQDLRGQSFSFFVAAPPRPSRNARLTYREVGQLGGAQGYSERVAVRRDGLSVTVSFARDAKLPLAYGKSWFAGWDRGLRRPTKLRVTVKSITIVDSLDPNHDRPQQTGAPPGEYNLYLNANGRWDFIGGRPPLDPDTSPQWAPQLGAVTDGQTIAVNHSVELFVPRGSPLRLDVSGRECDLPRMEPCLADGEVSDGNDHPGQAIVTYPSAGAALGDHTIESPLHHWRMAVSVAKVPGPTSGHPAGGPSPPGGTGVSTSQPGGDLGGRGTVTDDSGSGVVGHCVDRTAPRSRFARRRLRASRRRILLRGLASDRACGHRGRVARVTIALARKVRGGRRCRWLQAGGRFGRVTGCRKATYVAARGTKHWRLRIGGPLRRGRYVARCRAIDAAGNVERKHRLRGRHRNFVKLTVR